MLSEHAAKLREQMAFARGRCAALHELDLDDRELPLSLVVVLLPEDRLAADPTPAAPRAHQNAPSRPSPPSNTASDNDIAVRIGATPDQAEGPDENRGDDVPSVTSRAEESVMDKGVFRYDTDKTRLGAPPAPWDPSHREIL